MESEDDDLLSNARDSPGKDQTLIPTLDQDQEGDGEGKKAKPEADADSGGAVDLLLDQIRALKDDNRELELRLGDASKEFHRVEADNRSIAAHVNFLEGKLARTRMELAAASKDVDAETDSLKRALKDLEADKSRLADANAEMNAEISALEVRFLSASEGKEVNALALRTRSKLLELRVLGLTRDLRHAKEAAEAAVKKQVEIRELREKELNEAIKALEESKTRLEIELAEVLSEIDRHLEIQREHDAAVEKIARSTKVYQMVAGVASVGALTVVAVTVYDLRVVG